MKKLLLLLLLTVGTFTIQAQELQWQTDVKAAMKLSKESNKPMFLFFTGSDWCGWCKRLQKEVFITPEFAAWAKENVILVELDFPKRTAQDMAIKQQNAQLAQVFQVRGYPTVWITNAETNAEGKVSFKPLGNTGYVAGGPTAWLGKANEIMAKK